MSDAARENLIRWRERPDLFVREVFGVTPDAWQDLVLRAFPTHPRLALLACKGPGKTCLLAWLCWNFLLTRPQCNIGATSITSQNLADGLWKEMAKWLAKSPMLQAGFEWTGKRIFAKAAPATWFMAAKPWARSANSDEQANTLAGFHADYIMFVIDESGGIPDAVMAAAEAALSSCIEGHIIQAGNPTTRSGPLWRAARADKSMWWLISITGDPDSPLRSPRISVEWAKAQIKAYGRRNPWVMVNVFGEFPPSSLLSLISMEEVEASMKRTYTEHQIGRASKVLGVDVARGGADSSVLYPRWGIQALMPKRYRNLDSIQGAGVVARMIDDFHPDATFIDETGGFGAGWIDNLRRLNYTPIGVLFSASAHNKERYHNKRTEMIFDGIQWIKDGGALYPSTEMKLALTETSYTFHGDALLIEPKDMIKAKIGFSPDEMDAFVETFAEPVSPKATQRFGNGQATNPEAYNPYASMDKPAAGGAYNAFRDM